MNSTMRTGLLLVVAVTGVSACTSVLGGFDFDGKTGATGTGGTSGSGGMTATATATTGGTGGMTTTTSGTSGASSSSSGTGGSMCSDPVKDCPPPANECVPAVCDGGGLCAVKNADNGAAVATQTPADCKKVVCDGDGKTTSIDDNADIKDDGLECTTDTCSAGVEVHTPIAVKTACGAGGSLKCDAAGACVGCIDVGDCGAAVTCKVNTCTDGVCGVANAADATACSDGNGCTQTDVCMAGVCTGSNPVVCVADQCHDAGTCDAATGMCSASVAKSNGASCNNDNSACTPDKCQVGICTAGSAKVCIASDQCHMVGTCAPATGICTNPTAPNGASCGDGNACTQSDTCQGGGCTGANPVVCSASDQCHIVGTCMVLNGTCTNPLKPDGTACSNGGDAGASLCSAGVCM